MARIRELVDSLDRLGFYSLCLPSTAEQVRRESIDWKNVLHEGTRRVFDLDAEDLHERGPIEFIRNVEPTIEQLGVKILQLEDPFVQGVRGDLVMNGRRFLLWQMPDERDENLWKLCTYRTLGSLNYLFEQAEIPDRFFCSYIGNDTTVVLALPAVLNELVRADNADYTEPGFRAIPRIEPLTEL